MTLIHDYDGDPNQTYYNSKFLAAGWLPQDPTWSVHTAEETYQGVINITKATTVSDNTVYAQLAADLGWDKLDATARAMGITSQLTGNPSEVIGGLADCCTMLEMADAYATLANGGSHVPPTIIDQVVFPSGRVVNLGNPPHTRVFTDGEAYEGTQVLKTVIQSGTGTAANYGCPAAGKTGTAENLDNAWFVGYTPQDLDRGLGRLSAGQPPDGERIRRHACRADLARLHGRRLATGTAATSPSPPSRSPERRSRGRTRPHASRPRPLPGSDRAGRLHEPEPLRPAAQAGHADHHDPDRWGGAAGRSGGTAGSGGGGGGGGHHRH